MAVVPGVGRSCDCLGVGILAGGAGVGFYTIPGAGGFGGDGTDIIVDAVVFCGHGVSIVEGFALIVFPTEVVGEIFLVEQEPAVNLVASIPGGVSVVVLAIQLHDVPAVVFALGGAGDQSAVDIQLQSQAVHQQGIALADRGAVDQGGIGGLLQQIGIILGMGIVVDNIGADIIVNAFDLEVVVLLVKIQLFQKLSHSRVHFGFLLGGGVISVGIGDGQIGGAVIVQITAGISLQIAVLPHQVVTFGGNTGMYHGIVGHFEHQSLGGGAVEIFHVEIDHNGFFAVLHAVTDDVGCFTFIGQVGDIHTVGHEPGRFGLYLLLGNDSIGIQGIDIVDFQVDGGGFGGAGFDGPGGESQQTGQHQQGQQGSDELASSFHKALPFCGRFM